MRHAIRSLVLSSLLLFISEKAFATNYVILVPGGTYECGYLKDGKNEVVDRSKRPVSGEVAKAQLRMDVSKLLADREKLFGLRTTLDKSTKDLLDPSPKEIADYRSTINFVKNLSAKQFQKNLPPLNLSKSREEQIADLNSLITAINLQIANIGSEKTKLQDCIKNKRIVFGNITIQAIYIPTASDPNVAPLFLVPDNILYGAYRIKHAKSLTMCFSLPLQAGGTGKFAAYFTKNPCYSYDPGFVPFMSGFAANNCPYLVPPHYLAWLAPYNPNFGSTPTQSQVNVVEGQVYDLYGQSEEGVYISDSSDPCLKKLEPVS